MNKIEMFKTASSIIVSLGVGSIVGNAIKSTTPLTHMGAFKKFTMAVGGFVLSSMVCDHAAKYTEEKIDSAVVEAKKMLENGELG